MQLDVEENLFGDDVLAMIFELVAKNRLRAE